MTDDADAAQPITPPTRRQTARPGVLKRVPGDGRLTGPPVRSAEAARSAPIKRIEEPGPPDAAQPPAVTADASMPENRGTPARGTPTPDSSTQVPSTPDSSTPDSSTPDPATSDTSPADTSLADTSPADASTAVPDAEVETVATAERAGNWPTWLPIVGIAVLVIVLVVLAQVLQ